MAAPFSNLAMFVARPNGEKVAATAIIRDFAPYTCQTGVCSMYMCVVCCQSSLSVIVGYCTKYVRYMRGQRTPYRILPRLSERFYDRLDTSLAVKLS